MAILIVMHTALSLGMLSCLALAACAESRPPLEYPGSHACHYIGLESNESPQFSRQSDRDAVFLTAVYKFDESDVPAPKEPVTVKFQVDRSRVQELKTHLESQQQVICTPDRDQHYRPRVKPFKRGARPSITGPGNVAPASSLSPVTAVPEAPERQQNR